MTKHLRIPDSHTSERLLINLRRTRVEMESFNLKVAEIVTQLELETISQKQSRTLASHKLTTDF